MKNYGYYLIGICLLAISCEKSTVEPAPFKDGAVHFKDLKAGQQSRFIRYTLNCNDFEQSFQWTGDTLVLKVIEEGKELYFQESLTPQSPIYLQGGDVNPVTYLIERQLDQLYLPQREDSRLFYFYGSDFLILKKEPSILLNRLEQDNCYMNLKGEAFIGDEIGIIDRFELGDFKIEDKMAVSCIPIYLGIDAYLGYDLDQLYMSHVIHKSEFNDQQMDSVEGWFLLEE
ncbi:MAG: hypothetical protein KTR30_16765 [Saprospiraceae bacterium]|nr:hypothetical protein [Saprospiraceae bacterium]